MQAMSKALEEMKGLYEKVVGTPAPQLRPSDYVPFPIGVDPLQHALLEARQCAGLSEYTATAPRPGAWVPAADSFLAGDELLIRLGRHYGVIASAGLMALVSAPEDAVRV